VKTFMHSLILFLFCAPQLIGRDLNPDWREKLSQPRYGDIRFRMYQVPMPDSIELSVAAWTPDVEGQNFPTILIATPCNKLSDRIYCTGESKVFGQCLKECNVLLCKTSMHED
jgi:hypothetical protein